MITASITFKDENRSFIEESVTGDIRKAIEGLLVKYNKNNEVAIIGVHDDRYTSQTNLIARFLSDTVADFIAETIGFRYKENGIQIFK